METFYYGEDIVFEVLNKEIHDRKNFDCGVSELNSFIERYASQQQSKNLSTVYVSTYKNSNHLKVILGYYTLSANAISFKEFPDNFLKNIPHNYPIPTIKIGRLARDITKTKKGFGEIILGDALYRCLKISDNLGTLAIDVDAKNQSAIEFYCKNGFVELKDQPNRLIIPINTLKKIFLQHKQEKILERV